MRVLLPIGLSLALAACSQAAPDPRGVAEDEVLLQVVATGRADARPDQARFSAGVETIAGTAGEASTRNNEVMDKVATALERLGIKGDDLQTRQITLNRIGYGPNRGKFQANNVVEVRVREVARAGEAIAATTEAGANVLNGPNLIVSDPEAASRSAYANAYKAARARAEAYAGAAGLTVSRVLTIRDQGEGDRYAPYPMDATMSVEAAPPPLVSPPPPVRPGVNSAEVRVRADFALAQE